MKHKMLKHLHSHLAFLCNILAVLVHPLDHAESCDPRYEIRNTHVTMREMKGILWRNFEALGIVNHSLYPPLSFNCD